jgi:hypothetical protein
MLSKLWLIVSGGSSAETSTSIASKSRIARAYSARLRRWNGRQPGSGLVAAASSIRVSSAATRASMVDWSGRLIPAGGIWPARSLRIIFSVTSAVVCARAASNAASVSPLVFSLSLWHPVQNCLTTAVCAAGDVKSALSDCAGFVAAVR